MDEQQLWEIFIETGDPSAYVLWSQAQINPKPQMKQPEVDPWTDKLELW
ncbi:hypothetical protein RFF05_05775 [Bengtsoniella intestinalis]